MLRLSRFEVCAVSLVIALMVGDGFAFFAVRLIKLPRGAPGPRNQLSVRQKLSVREVPPDPENS